MKQKRPRNAKETGKTTVFCLFHERIDCDCIAPVTTRKFLVYRIESQIRLNDILSRHAPPDEVAPRQAENARLRARLATLKGE